MRGGPKRDADPSPLPLGAAESAAERFSAFCADYVTVPKGTGAGGRLALRPWQLALVASVLDAEPRPRLAGWMLPRGNGKSSLVAALALFELFTGPPGAEVDVIASDERQAGIALRTAQRMVELEPELERRCHLYQRQIRVPARGALLEVHPAEFRHLQGLDPSLAIVDELGFVDRRCYEALALAAGKRDTSTLLGIGTPGPDPADSVLLEMREYARAHPEDSSAIFREFSAAEFTDHPVDCEHCWQLANPALGDFLHRDALRAVLPPKTREATYRRARLCQFVSDHEGRFLPSGCWDGLGTGKPIPDGADVVLALDGSFNGDATALVVATVSPRPHFDVAGLWEPPRDDPDYRVNVADVEQAVRDSCRRWRVLEVTADPYRWTRTLQQLESENVATITEFPQSAQRMTPATSDFYKGAINGLMSHSGNPDLARHVSNSVVSDDARGVRIRKDGRHGLRIDLAVAAVMAQSRATWRARKQKTRRSRSFA